MGRIKATRNKNFTRPKKTGAAKRRRVLEQRKRLIAAGVPDVKANQLTIKALREALKTARKG